MGELSRREFLLASGGALAGCSGLSAAAVDTTSAPRARADYELAVGWIERVIDGRRVHLRAYEGAVPGPRLEVRPGETLRVRLVNGLTPTDSEAWTGDRNVPHAFDTTNLHLHGLEVAPHLFEPQGTSDPTAEMISILPGEALDYLFEVPDDHPTGLFWYHPHKHGSTAVQAVSGMAGLLVVRGAIDEVPEIAAAAEHFLAIQDIGLFPTPDDPDVWSYEPAQNAVWDTFTGSISVWNPASRSMEPAPDVSCGFTTGDYPVRYFLVNGQAVFRETHNPSAPTSPSGTQLPVPTFTMRPGEVARFRVLNGTSDLLVPLVVEEHTLYMIGRDGVNFPVLRSRPPPAGSGETTFGAEQVLLPPAGRAEFLVRARSEPGEYAIVQLPQSEQFLSADRKVLAHIRIAGEPVEMSLPQELPLPSRHYPLIDPAEVVRRRQVVFSGMPPPAYLNPIVGLDLMINDTLYDELGVAAVVERDSVEEWRIRVPDADHGGGEGHPFHIHVNSFELVSIDGVAQPAGTILDTVWVGKNSEVVIRMRFREWLGKAVYHCHILPHEDAGMMQNFLIAPASP